LYADTFSGKFYLRKRRCYVTKTDIVLKTERPTFFCCCFAKSERHIQLHDVVDITIEQSWLQQKLEMYSCRIQTAGHLRNSDRGDLVLQGVVNPTELRQVIMETSSNLKQNSYVIHEQQPIDLSKPMHYHEEMHDSYDSPVMQSRPSAAVTEHDIAQVKIGDAIVNISQSLVRIETLLSSHQQTAAKAKKQKSESTPKLQIPRSNEILDPNELDCGTPEE
jgi:hypothetical protein